MLDSTFLGTFGLSDGSGWILPPNLLSDNLIPDDHITDASSWEVLTDGVQLQYGISDKNGDNQAVRATLNDTNPNYIKCDLNAPLDPGATYRMVLGVRSRYYNFNATFKIAYSDGPQILKAKDYSLSYLWRTRTFNFVAPEANDPQIRLIGTNLGSGINEFEVGKIQLYKIVESPITDGSSDNTNQNLLDEPYVNAIDGKWNDTSTGSYQVTGVNDKNGDPVATEVFLQTGTDHHVWYNLDEPLTVGKKYNLAANLKPGTKGFSGQFELSYYDDNTEVALVETYLAPGWRNTIFSFTAQEATTRPNIRLIGWDGGSDGDSVVIGYVSLYEFNENITMDLLQDRGEQIQDIINFPISPAHFFNVPAPDTRNVANLIFDKHPVDGQSFSDYIGNTLNAVKLYNEANSEIRPARESPFGEAYLRTTCLAGYGNTDGGTGWETRFMSEESACFEYKIRFEPGFEWVKGGKLPGLYGGDSPSGGSDSLNGFSTRMMWRKNAQGEMYGYFINKMIEYGASVGRGMFHFKDGVWHTIKQEVILNTIGPNGEVYADGVFRLWFDGEPLFEANYIIYRQTADIKVEGIMYTIFFGGHDSTWAPSENMSIDTGDYKIWAPVV